MSATVREKTLAVGDSGAMGTRSVSEAESAARTLMLISSELHDERGSISEPSTPLHSFLEHSTLFLFPLLFALNIYFGLARLPIS